MARRNPFEDHDITDLEAELSEARDDRVSPLILLAGLAGLVVGLFVWGSVAMSVLSTAGDVLDEFSTRTQAALAAVDTVTPTPEPTPSPTAIPTPTATPTPDPSVNRLNCNQIRGTDYRSPEERTWYLANCVTR